MLLNVHMGCRQGLAANYAFAGLPLCFRFLFLVIQDITNFDRTRVQLRPAFERGLTGHMYSKYAHQETRTAGHSFRQPRFSFLGVTNSVIEQESFYALWGTLDRGPPTYSLFRGRNGFHVIDHSSDAKIHDFKQHISRMPPLRLRKKLGGCQISQNNKSVSLSGLFIAKYFP